MGTECSAFGRVVFPIYRSSAFSVGLCLEFTRQVTCGRKVFLTCGSEAQVCMWVVAYELSAVAATRKVCPPFLGAPCTRVPDGVWCFPLESVMCAECSLFWFPMGVCLSEGLALPPMGFGCRELFIWSVPSGSSGVSDAGDPLLLRPYPREPRGRIQFPLGPGMWAGVGSVGGLFCSAVSGVPTCLGSEVSLPWGLGAESCCGQGSAGLGLLLNTGSAWS